MTSRVLAASLLLAVATLSAAGSVTAQSDKIRLTDGTTIDSARVMDWDIRQLKYSRKGSTESVQSDRVAKVELGEFKSVYARGLRDPDVMLTQAREQLNDKKLVLAQLGFVHAANGFFDAGRAAEAVAALGEMQKALPEGGAVPEVYRQKFEYYMGLGSKNYSDANTVAKKYAADAIGNAWPDGFGVEAEFFQVLSTSSSPAEFQKQLRTIVGKARTANPTIANRANVELAHSLRKNKDADGAQRIYEELIARDGVDDSARAGAYLGLGLIKMEGAGENTEQFKEALLLFLRVRLETRNAWPSLQAEALYHATDSAAKWRGPEYRYYVARCRSMLLNEFKGTEWADRMRQR